MREIRKRGIEEVTDRGGGEANLGAVVRKKKRVPIAAEARKVSPGETREISQKGTEEEGNLEKGG